VRTIDEYMKDFLSSSWMGEQRGVWKYPVSLW
jgi:hypothetical protein